MPSVRPKGLIAVQNVEKSRVSAFSTTNSVLSYANDRVSCSSNSEPLKPTDSILNPR